MARETQTAAGLAYYAGMKVKGSRYKCDKCGAEYTDIPVGRGPNLVDCPACNPDTLGVNSIWIKSLGANYP